MVHQGLWSNRRQEQFEQSEEEDSGDDLNNDEQPTIDPSESITGLIHGFNRSKLEEQKKKQKELKESEAPAAPHVQFSEQIQIDTKQEKVQVNFNLETQEVVDDKKEGEERKLQTNPVSSMATMATTQDLDA